MFARGVFSFNPARLPAFPQNRPTPIIPALARSSSKSNYSRTYTVPGEGDIPVFLSDQFTALFPQKPCAPPSFFSISCALFHFPYHTYLPPFLYLPHSFQKNRGCTPCLAKSGPERTGRAKLTRLGRRPLRGNCFYESPVTDHQSLPLPHQPPLLPLPPPFPFTAHSQFCYRAFTHPSPWLVTMDPSQGTNSYTMPTVNTRPTVHFYRCDPPGEIRS